MKIEQEALERIEKELEWHTDIRTKGINEMSKEFHRGAICGLMDALSILGYEVWYDDKWNFEERKGVKHE